MKFLPPRRFSERYEWARAHPWLAGFSWGIAMWAVFAAVALVGGAPARAFLFLAVVCAGGAVVFGAVFRVSVRRGWFEVPNADALPMPTLRRPWVRSSERVLVSTFRCAIGAAVFLFGLVVIRVVNGETWSRWVLDVALITGCGWIAFSVRRERALRDQGLDDVPA